MTHTPLEWWQPDARPACLLHTADNNLAEGPTLGADEVISDVCTADLRYTPVAVSRGYALCPECFEKERGLRVEAAARRDGITLTWPGPEKEGHHE